MPPTTAWSETTPAGSDSAGQGDDRIRELKTQLREVIAVDHEMASSGSSATTGHHKVVRLEKQVADPAVSTDEVQVYAKDVDGAEELCVKDAAGNVIQLTSAGALNTGATSYNTGTVTVTNGSATVSGASTAWTSAYNGGGFLGPDGEFYGISSVGGVSTITLDRVYAGANASGAAYTIYTNSHPLYLQKGGGTVNGALSVGGALSVTGALTLAGEVVSAGAKKVGIAVGTAYHGDTLPLPSGFLIGECFFFVACSGYQVVGTQGHNCTVNQTTGVVTCFAYDSGGGHVPTYCNYLVIGVK